MECMLLSLAIPSQHQQQQGHQPFPSSNLKSFPGIPSPGPDLQLNEACILPDPGLGFHSPGLLSTQHPGEEKTGSVSQKCSLGRPQSGIKRVGTQGTYPAAPPRSALAYETLLASQNSLPGLPQRRLQPRPSETSCFLLPEPRGPFCGLLPGGSSPSPPQPLAAPALPLFPTIWYFSGMSSVTRAGGA